MLEPLVIGGGLLLGMSISGAYAHWRERRRRAASVPPPAPLTPPPARPRAVTGTIPAKIVRPGERGGVEGLEISYPQDGLVRSVRVGAMNSEHKELLLVMDTRRWCDLTNADKQEVVAAARSTWAERMCGEGPDVAYITVQTEHGEIVGRGNPSRVTVR